MASEDKGVVIYTWAIPKGGLFKVIEKEFDFLTEKLHRLVFATSELVPEPYQENFSRLKGICLSNNRGIIRNSDLGFFFPGLDISMKGGILSSVWRVHAFLKREKPRIILAHQLLSALLVLPYAFVHRTKILLVLHDNPFMFVEKNSTKSGGLKSFFLRTFAYRLEKFTIRRAKHVLCTTSRIKDSVMKHLGNGNNLTVADYGIDSFPRVGKENRDMLLTVSKWSRFRKPENYAELLKHLPSNISLTVAGRWDSEDDLSAFLSKVLSMGLQDRVEVLKNLTEVELSDLFDRTKVFLRLGFNESGTGQAILEAIGHGCPVVISRGLGAAEIVQDGVNGFLVDENQPAIVASRINDIFGSSALLDSMSESSYKIAESSGWEDYLRKILEAIQ